MDLGTAIRTLRKNKGMTAKDLAAKIRISANSMSQIENNLVHPTKMTISKICKALNIPPSYLLFFVITDEDLPEKSKVVFNALRGPIEEVLLKEI